MSSRMCGSVTVGDSTSADDLVDGFEELAHAHRLGHVLPRSRVEHPLHLAFGCVGAEHHHGDVPGLRRGLEPLEDQVTVDIGEVHVEQDQRGTVFHGESHGVFATHRCHQTQSWATFEDLFDELHGGQVVL